MWEILAKFIDADKLAGWVRAGIAALFTFVLLKFPSLTPFLSDAVRDALSVLAVTGVVGLWSQLSKSDTAKVAMVDALAKEPDSPVKGVVTENTVAGRELADSLTGNTTASAGTSEAKTIASTGAVTP